MKLWVKKRRKPQYELVDTNQLPDFHKNLAVGCIVAPIAGTLFILAMVAIAVS